MAAKAAKGKGKSAASDVEETPSTHPEKFKPVRGRPGKEHTETGEVWEKDKMHKDHWEVYKSRKKYEGRDRDRSTWEDGRPKDKF